MNVRARPRAGGQLSLGLAGCHPTGTELAHGRSGWEHARTGSKFLCAFGGCGRPERLGVTTKDLSTGMCAGRRSVCVLPMGPWAAGGCCLWSGAGPQKGPAPAPREQLRRAASRAKVVGRARLRFA